MYVPDDGYYHQYAASHISMGASDSKLVFKQGIFRLSEPALIPEDDRYWTGVSARSSSAARLALICAVLGASRFH